MKWIVKKEIEAKTIQAAIRNENKAEIVDVYRSEQQEPQVNTYAIGFNVDVDREIDKE